MVRFVSAIIALLYAAPALAVGAPEVVALRTGEGKAYKRVVVETSAPVRFIVSSGGKEALLKLEGAGLGSIARTLSTDFMEIKAFEPGDGSSQITLKFKENSRVRQSVLADPFRVVIDVYPQKPAPSNPLIKEDLDGLKAKEKASEKAASVKVRANVTDFNVGWRWVYREKAVEAIKKDTAPVDTFIIAGAELGITSTDRDSFVKESRKALEALEEKGEKEKAALLGAVLQFIDGKLDARGLEGAAGANKGSGLDGVAYYLLGSRYDDASFYPEATAYYSMAIKGAGGSSLKGSAELRKGRIFFLEGRYDRAAASFRKALEAGVIEARSWLAGALLIKGDEKGALALFKEAQEDGEKALGPLSLMGFADAAMLEGEYNTAREAYGKLAAMYSGTEFLKAYFTIRAGDTLMADGKRDEAIDAYRKAMGGFKDEGLAIATLAIADAFISGSDDGEVFEAGSLYSSVADGSYIGSEYAHIGAARSLMGLGKHGEALGVLKAMARRYPIGRFRHEANDAEGEAAYRWITSLCSSPDNYGCAKAFSAHSAKVRFGRKAEIYYLAGRAFSGLGLLSDAVSLLNASLKIGTGEVAEDAMLALGEAYLAQGDYEAAERSARAFPTRFRNSRRMDTAEKVLLQALYGKGDYGKVAATVKFDDDGGILMIKGDSLERLGRHTEAASAFEKAAAIFAGMGLQGALVNAEIRAADANFSAGRFPKAAALYSSASSRETLGEEDATWALYRLAESYSKVSDLKGKTNAAGALEKRKDELSRIVLPLLKKPGDL